MFCWRLGARSARGARRIDILCVCSTLTPLLTVLAADAVSRSYPLDPSSFEAPLYHSAKQDIRGRLYPSGPLVRPGEVEAMKMKLASACTAQLLLLTGVCRPRTPAARLTDRITDPSGAVVPGASVVVTNAAMGLKTVRHDQSGRLLPGALPASGDLPDRSRSPRASRRPSATTSKSAWPTGWRSTSRSRSAPSEQPVTITAEAAAAEHRVRLPGHRRRCQARRRPAALLRQSLPADRPYRGRNLQRQRPPRPSRSSRPTSSTSPWAEPAATLNDITIDGAPTTATRQRQPSDRLLRAAHRHRAGVQGPDRHLRRAVRPDPGRRHQHQHQERHQQLPRQRQLLLPAPQFLGQRFLPEQGRHAASGLPVQPLGRLLQRPGPHPESLQRQEQDLLPVRL